MMTFSSTSQSLSNFLSNKKETISINSKLYILINILQALRLIKDYKVVHMDLHPSNVLVNSNYITNLIDFGESYQ
jgi:serine/threonine protein kinase